MLIGLDFDNTIVSYDALFHKVAREQSLLSDDVPVNKLAVRDYLRHSNREALWTEMQGYVYGARMKEAEAYPAVIPFLQRMRERGHTLAIMSHKTKHPYLGKAYDLHQAAREWIEYHLTQDNETIIPAANIFFELTKEEKIARIRDFGCDVFIDDLPEILLAKTFPTKTRRILFDPEQHHRDQMMGELQVVSSWTVMDNYL